MSNNKFTLTLLDTTGIQDYIFASNRLQENIGASEIVYRATTLWAFKALGEADITNHNIELIKKRDAENKEIVIDWKFKEGDIEKTDVQAEVLQAAGGNTVILFRDKNVSRKFVQKLTLRLLKEAPGLTVLAQHFDGFDFSSDSLYEARKTLEANMRAHKLSRLPSIPTLGLGVTATCDSTGLVAVRTPLGAQKLEIEDESFPLLVPGQDTQASETTRLISRETTYKLAARDLANRRLKYIVGDVTDWYEFPSLIDNLGRISGEESYVAVVHADGNRLGEHVTTVAKNAKDNRDYITAMRSFSTTLDAASRAALTKIVTNIVASIKDGKVAGEIPLIVDEYHTYIPFRPLVFGGDDITFLCNGQLGVELAAQYLKVFEEELKELAKREDVHPLAKRELEKLHACAGTSIVKMHYPFSRAYKLAEELASSAKSLTRETDCAALDWHFAQSGLSGSLDEIRDKEYSVPESSVKSILEENDLTDVEEKNKRFLLTMRPIRLFKSNDSRHWFDNQGLEKLVETLQKNKPWADSHNKVIGLREELRKGALAVDRYLLDFGLDDLPTVIPGSERTGWYKSKTPKDSIPKEKRELECRCVYFDAIELLDHHVSLKNKEVTK